MAGETLTITSPSPAHPPVMARKSATPRLPKGQKQPRTGHRHTHLTKPRLIGFIAEARK